MPPESPQPPNSTTYLDRVRKTPLGRAVGAIVVAVGVLPNFVDSPLLPRWGGWALILVIATFLVSGALTSSERVAWSFTAMAILATVLAVFVLLPDLSGREQAPLAHPPEKEEPQIVSRAVGVDPVATIFAFGRRWVLHSHGEVLGMNRDGSNPVSFSVKGPATGIVACEGALVITYGRGYVGRFSPNTHRRLARYRYGYVSQHVVCGGGYVWVDKPGSQSIVQLDAQDLKLVVEIPIAADATSIAYGMGAIWVADATRNRVLGIDGQHRQLLGPFAVMADAAQILAADGYLWVLHPQQSCLLRLDVHRGREVGPGIALGTTPSHMRQRDGAIFVTDYSDDTVIEVDIEKVRTTGRPLLMPDAGRLTDVDERRGDLFVIDRAKGQLLMVDPAAQSMLRHASKVTATRSQDCPAP